MICKGLGRWFSTGLLVGGALLGSSANAFTAEVYTATLVRPMGVRADKVANLTLTIESYATEEDAERYQKVLDAEGSDGLIKALRETKRGTAQVQGDTPRTINHVRVYESESGSARIIIVTDRPLFFPDEEPMPSSRAHLGFIQLDLNKHNEGGGNLAEVVQIGVAEDGGLMIGSASRKPIQLKDVRREQ
jgi:hypothetical protein